MKAKKEGFTDVVYLDARSDTYLEELSAANIFSVTVRPSDPMYGLHDHLTAGAAFLVHPPGGA